MARYGRTGLDDADAATLQAVADVIVAWQLARPEPFAVLHGDYRLDNLMLPPTGQDGVVALDWQGVIVGLPARDLSYFVCTSLDVDTRRDAERDLVGSYHRELVAHGVDDYQLERCFDDYRFGLLQVPLTMVVGCVYATGRAHRRVGSDVRLDDAAGVPSDPRSRLDRARRLNQTERIDTPAVPGAP